MNLEYVCFVLDFNVVYIYCCSSTVHIGKYLNGVMEH